MRYTLETSNTIAGSVLVGIYDTLHDAKIAAKNHRCKIRPIYNTTLDNVTAPATLADLNELLDNIEKIR